MAKIRNFIKRHKGALIASCTSALLACMSVVSFSAADGDTANTNIVSQFSTSLQQMQGDIVNLILAAVPIALTIFGLIIAVNKGIGVVKGMLGKAS